MCAIESSSPGSGAAPGESADFLTSSDALFYGGPPARLLERLGLYRPSEPHLLRRAMFSVLIGWLPLAVLSAVQELVLHRGGLASFATDFAVHARGLITVPTFILMEAILSPRLGTIARQFLTAGLVADHDRPRFADAAASTRRLLDSIFVEGAVIVTAYALVVFLIAELPVADLPEWQRFAGYGTSLYSAAGWWHMLVSLPLLVVLFLGWLWRLLLWARFLWRMAHLDLSLIPSHPDQAGGLMFVSSSVRDSFPLGLALGAIVAGSVANGVAHRGASPLAFRNSLIVLLVFMIILCSGPLLVFVRKLYRARWGGVLAYGALAHGLGLQFERRWFERSALTSEDPLQAPDFSATTDLYQVVSNVYAMRLLPIDLRAILPLVIATLLPFVPVLLMVVPLETILSNVTQMLF